MTLSMLLPILPEIWLAFWGLLMLLVVAGTAEKGAVRASRLAVMGFLGSFVLQWSVAAFVPSLQTLPFVKIDLFSRFIGDLIILIGLGLALMGRDYLERHRAHKGEFYVLLLYCLLGMRLLVIADSFLMLYLGLEMLSFTLYILAAFMREDAKSSEAGLKYFLLGGFASGILLYGVSILYGLTGDVSYTAVAAGLSTIMLSQPDAATQMALAVGVVFVLTGILFKLSVVPFHMWTPDVYEGAPTPVTALLATAPKLAAAALLMRVLFEPLVPVQHIWQPVLAVLAAGSMLLGSIMAIIQTNIKRLLAYSSIAQVGFLLVGVAAGNADGLAGTLFYLAVYIATQLGIFAVLLQMRRRQVDLEHVDDLTGLGRSHPALAFVLLLCLLSLAGIPPLAGFFSKLYVFKAALDANMLWLVIVGVVSSAIAVAYSLKLLKDVYFSQGDSQWESKRPVSLQMVGVISAGISVALFIVPQPWWTFAKMAVSHWF